MATWIKIEIEFKKLNSKAKFKSQYKTQATNRAWGTVRMMLTFGHA
jgi:hypothetical protein